jgi:hypothetical protein
MSSLIKRECNGRNISEAWRKQEMYIAFWLGNLMIRDYPRNMYSKRIALIGKLREAWTEINSFTI